MVPALVITSIILFMIAAALWWSTRIVYDRGDWFLPFDAATVYGPGDKLPAVKLWLQKRLPKQMFVGDSILLRVTNNPVPDLEADFEVPSDVKLQMELRLSGFEVDGERWIEHDIPAIGSTANYCWSLLAQTPGDHEGALFARWREGSGPYHDLGTPLLFEVRVQEYRGITPGLRRWIALGVAILGVLVPIAGLVIAWWGL